MFEISAGGGIPTSAKSAFSGKSGKIPTGSGLLARIKDAMTNGTGSYRDIDNAFSAGGHDGNGSPQSALVISGKPDNKGNSSGGSPRGSSGSPRGSSGSSSGSSGVPTVAAPSAAALDYLNADLAKHYGMDEVTAYNEALSNTAYQRAVKDMQAAGLNPAVLFGHGRVEGADGVYGAELLQPVETSASGAYHSSGHSGSSGSRSRSRAGRSGKLFSSDSYAMISGLGSLAGAGIAAATGGSVGLGALTGSSVATSAAKVLNGLWKKR